MNDLEYQNKLSDLDKKAKNTVLVYSTAGLVGGIAGLGYAVYKQKTFWGKVGFFILGSLAVGVPVRIAMISKANSLVAEKEKLQNEYNASKSKTK